jgi:hypothetical protein
MFWKIGKQERQENTTNKVKQLESQNVIYNVPYDEQILD